MKFRKGTAPVSSTRYVSYLIGALALFIALYFLLLPSEIREGFLEGEGKVEEVISRNLILEFPGVVYPYSKEVVEKQLPSANLFSTVELETLSLANTLEVSRTIFNNNYKDLSFKLEDFSNVKDAELFFGVKEKKGNFLVILNDEVIFKGDLSISDLPIKLPVDSLKERNKLRIGCAFPGWRFLSRSFYDLMDVKVIKRYRSENKKEIMHFFVEGGDKLKDGNLRFFINCLETKEKGILKVNLNGFNIHTGRVFCLDNEIKLDVVKDYFLEGKNVLSFEIDKGNYVIEQVLFELNFETGYFPKYYFTLGEDDLKEEVELKMKFSEGRKRGTVLVNGKRIYLDTYEDYKEDISSWVKEGENYIKVIPDNEFEIIELEVNL